MPLNYRKMLCKNSKHLQEFIELDLLELENGEKTNEIE